MRVTGAPGSGKTYFSKRLAEAWKIPHYEMDREVFFHPDDTDYTRKRELKDREAILSGIVKKKRWILDGGYTSSWARSAFEQADIVILILPPRWKRIFRVIRRFFHRRFSDRECDERLSGLFDLLGWTWHYERRRIPRLEKYAGKLNRFRSADEAFEALTKL